MLPEINNTLVDYFLNMASFKGLMTLYFSKIKLEKKFAFKKSDLNEYPIGTDAQNYSYGFLVACASIGLIEFTISNDVINVIEINPYLKSKLKEKLVQIAEGNDPSWMKQIEDIEKK